TPTAMVGRERELGLLRGALHEVESDRRLRTATVLAEAGLGKSRLCETFVQEQQRRGTRTLIATAWPRTEQQAFGLLRELVLRFLESGHGTSPLEPGAALESETMRALLIDPNEHDANDRDPMALAHLLGYAIGLGFEESPHVRGLRAERGLLRQRVFHAATLWLRNLTGRAPLLLLIDDLHWADDATLDLLLLWREALIDLPLCLVALARPSLLERRPRWTTTDSTARTIELGPLAEEESRELAARVLAGDSRVPEGARASLLARAQGNPYYLEELLAMLVDEPGAVDAGRERSGSSTSLLSRLPVTLTAALQARLSRLDGDTRRALQQASVVGPHFSEAALRAVDANAPRFLAALEAQGLVHAEGSDGWRFHHQLLQEVAYDSLLRRERAEWHARVAAHAAERGDSSPTSIAEHYDRAGNAPAAVQHYLRALEDTGRMGLKEQLQLGERALQLAPDLDESARLRLHRICLRCFLEMRQPDRATVHADAARAIADLREDDALRADLAFELALFEEPAPDPASADAVVELAKRAASRGQASPLAAAYALYAWALCTHGRAEEAYSIAREALAVADAAGEPPPSQALTSAAIAAWKLGDLSAGLAYVRTGLDIDRQRGNRAGELSGHCNLAGMARTLGDRQAWSQALEDGFRLARQLGNRVSEPLLRVRRAQLALLDGRIDAALADTQHALDLLPPQDRWFRITALLARGHALLAARDGAAAEQSFAEARLGAGEDAGMQAEALEGLVRTALARGETALALDRARELRAAIDAPEPGDITERPAQLLAIFDALTAARDPGAAAVLNEARAEVTAQAARISDPDSRERFLHAVSHNARIVGEPSPDGTRRE
ncbi:MAG: AAA family ATPase, partial [Candidatus Eisenbacteria bacterium]